MRGKYKGFHREPVALVRVKKKSYHEAEVFQEKYRDLANVLNVEEKANANQAFEEK